MRKVSPLQFPSEPAPPFGAEKKKQLGGCEGVAFGSVPLEHRKTAKGANFVEPGGPLIRIPCPSKGVDFLHRKIRRVDHGIEQPCLEMTLERLFDHRHIESDVMSDERGTPYRLKKFIHHPFLGFA